MHEITEVLNAGQHVRTYNDSYGTKYVFNVLTDKNVTAQVSKQTQEPPRVGDVYKTLKQPPDNAPEGALPTLRDKDYGDSSSGSQGNSGGRRQDKSFEADPRKLRAENMRSALHLAKDLWGDYRPNVSDPVMAEQIIATGELFYDAIEAKAQVGSGEPAESSNLLAAPGNSGAGATAGSPGTDAGPSTPGTANPSQAQRNDSPAGAHEITVNEVLKAKLSNRITPEDFSMICTSVGAESVQGADQDQRVAIIQACEARVAA